MRKAPLTDSQKTDEGLFGSYAPRVREHEVTAQSKDDLRTRGGGAAMNSKIAFVSAMLALAATSLLTPQAHARKPRPAEKACTLRGFAYHATLGCADKSCNDKTNGKGEPGELHVLNLPDNTTIIMMCDGFTGKWTEQAPRPKPPRNMAPGPPLRAPQ